MTFIPIVTAIHAQQPSPKARELNQLLSHAVREYRSRNPGISSEEVRHAVELTRQEVAATSGNGPALIFAAGLFVLGLAIFLGLGTRSEGGDVLSGLSPIVVVLGALVIGGVMFLLAKARGR